MDVIEIKISDVSPDPGNVRRHSDRNVEAIKASLRRFGQQKPIVVDGHGIVRAGNGTLAAATALGWKTIKAVRTDLTGSEATAYAIADNRTGDPELGSTFDRDALADTLAALRAENEALFEATGYGADELAALIDEEQQRAAATDPTPPDDFPEYDESIDVQHECPKCKYVWSGSSRPAEAA